MRRLLIVAAAVVTFVVTLSAGSHAINRTGWRPGELTEPVAASSTAVFRIGLVAPFNLRRVEFRLSSTLSGAVTVTPSSIDRVLEGDLVALTLSAAIPPNSLPDTVIQGSLQPYLVLTPRVSLPLPFVRPLSIKLTVQDAVRTRVPSLPVQVSLPTSYSVSTDSSSVVATPKSQPPSEVEGTSLLVTFEPNPGDLSIQDYFDGDPGSDLFGSATNSNVVVQGRDALRFDPLTSLAHDVIIVIPLSSGFLSILDLGAAAERSGALETVLNSIDLNAVP